MSIFNTFADQLRAFSDDDLLAAWARIGDDVEEPEAAALLAEIDRRGLPRPGSGGLGGRAS